MEDKEEKLGQDSNKDSDINLVDASIQPLEDPATISKEDDRTQNPIENLSKSGTNEENETVALAGNDQVMLDAHDDKAAADDGQIDGGDVKEKPLENKSNVTDGRIEIHLEATAPLAGGGYSTPVVQSKNVWLSNVEVLKSENWAKNLLFTCDFTNYCTSILVMLVRIFVIDV